MAFGQSAGPPATARQVEELRGLLKAAGHSDFRDARGPMGFNQRQAGGRFTREEAEELIAQLEAEAEAELGHSVAASPDGSPVVPTQRSVPTLSPVRVKPQVAKSAMSLQHVPAHLLAAELQRRGWIVVEP